ncbi:uncharacterized protein LOC132599968 isoform X2 [Lycium barbarum]|uniref:uncharacterized protein LOC132599968 isoform X2 n=1 Tax=Lycium barbarum TaxID=112863 RepID=UPI00293ED623|nr:uncharacterized protein LOC132599968 isoform X2 [Lycium barbarum]
MWSKIESHLYIHISNRSIHAHSTTSDHICIFSFSLFPLSLFSLYPHTPPLPLLSLPTPPAQTLNPPPSDHRQSTIGGAALAFSGYLVVVPDFFYGEPLDREKHNIQTWLKDHGTDKGCEDGKAVVEHLKSKGVSAIGAAGFYWGGLVVSKLAKYESTIGAAVILHPGPITVDEINGVKVPIAILAAENDHIFSPDQAKLLDKALSAKSEIESFVKIFPRVEHGWTVRYNIEDESAVKSAEEAHSDMLNWFTKFIK